jgi:P-type E1-E2 ATPase
MEAKQMINIDIPGWENITIENLVLDLNGTIATDGKILNDVKERIKSLSQKIKVYILTADTQGSAGEESKEIGLELVKISAEDSKNKKFEFLKNLNLDRTIVVGNGNNDQLVLREAALGIAVLGEEGLSTQAMKNADLLVKNVSDALDLFLKPSRLIATLME